MFSYQYPNAKRRDIILILMVEGGVIYNNMNS